MDPPSVITEHFAYVRKASSETALSSRAAISAFFVSASRFLLKRACVKSISVSPGSFTLRGKMGSSVKGLRAF